MFDVLHNIRSNLIDATLAGFLDVAEVGRYAARVEPIIRTAAARRSGYVMLIDVSGCAIQSQEVVAAFQRHVARLPIARRVAVVTGDSTIRMQIRRILAGSGMAMFAERQEAQDWLLEAPHGLVPPAGTAPVRANGAATRQAG